MRARFAVRDSRKICAAGTAPVGREGMQEIEALADCLRVVVEELVSELPDEAREGTRLAMALFARSDLGRQDPAVRAIIARVFSVPLDSIERPVAPPPGRGGSTGGPVPDGDAYRDRPYLRPKNISRT
jgi:hypothetical protein